MIKWEYELIQIQPGQSLKALLKAAGDDGWEAWHYDDARKVVFVKREPEKIVLATALPDGKTC
jgi:hypothetical protein